jgi:hypothetical protein
MFGAQGLWEGRDLYHATPDVTRGLDFSGLIWTVPLSSLVRHRRGFGGCILTRILMGNKIIVYTPFTLTDFLTSPYVFPKSVSYDSDTFTSILRVFLSHLRYMVLAMRLRQTFTICSEWTRTNTSSLRRLTVYLGIVASILRRVTIWLSFNV